MRITYEKDSKLICSENSESLCIVTSTSTCMRLVGVWFCSASSSAHFGVPCAVHILFYQHIYKYVCCVYIENVDPRLLVLEFVQHCVEKTWHRRGGPYRIEYTYIDITVDDEHGDDEQLLCMATMQFIFNFVYLREPYFWHLLWYTIIFAGDKLKRLTLVQQI